MMLETIWSIVIVLGAMYGFAFCCWTLFGE